jgi:hypothetical protein
MDDAQTSLGHLFADQGIGCEHLIFKFKMATNHPDHRGREINELELPSLANRFSEWDLPVAAAVAKAQSNYAIWSDSRLNTKEGKPSRITFES